MAAPRSRAVERMMAAVRWIGFGACSLAALGYAAMLALAVLSWINIRRKRTPRPPQG